VYGNFPYPKSLGAAIQEVMRAGTNAGYAPAHGYETARAAVALKFTNANAPLTAEDVTITHGCGGALHMAFSALLNPGDNILLPAPGFSAYQTICQSLGVECKFYKLDVSSLRVVVACCSLVNVLAESKLGDRPRQCGCADQRSHARAPRQRPVESVRFGVLARAS
jgi:histidinol-phosphate/aromatic aminotransferase/cobyric acid decarboxylase-like protein